MKKWLIVAVAGIAFAASISTTRAESGWATAGKILTGVVAADILFNHIGQPQGGHGGGYGYSQGGSYGYGFSYGSYGKHSGYSVYYQSTPRVYYRPAPTYRCAPRYYRGYRCYP